MPVPISSLRGAINVGERKKKSSMVLIFLAWLVVGVPFAWGVYHTLLNPWSYFSLLRPKRREGSDDQGVCASMAVLRQILHAETVRGTKL